METLLQDLRYSLRGLARAPGFALAAVLTLAVGIGATTAIFTVVNGLLLRQLPIPEADRVVMLWARNAKADYEHANVSYPDFKDWRERTQGLASLAAFFEASHTLADRGESVVLPGARVSARFFTVLGARPVLGRDFTPDDDREGAERVAILSHGAWVRSFGSDAGVLGRHVQLDGRPCAIIGVMPAAFSLPGYEFMDVWTPLEPEAHAAERGERSFKAIGRLAPGVSVAAAQAELSGVARRLEAEYPRTNANVDVAVTRLDAEAAPPDVRLALFTLLGAVGFVLLIGCANIANLLLARGISREKELALRTALGAGRGRIVRQLLTEALTLAAAGGACGLLLAFWGVSWLVTLLPPETPRLQEIQPDVRVLAFALTLSLLSAVVFGLAPAWRAARNSAGETLKNASSRSAGGSRLRLQRGLIVAEVTLAFVLLAGAGLLLRSLLHLEQVDPGFRSEGVVSLEMAVPEAQYPEPAEAADFYERALDRIATVPGVRYAGAVTTLPMGGSNSWTNITVEGGAAAAPRELRVGYLVVTPGYFESLAIPLREGRVFARADRPAAAQVAVVNEDTAQRLWPGQDPIGKRFKRGHVDSTRPWVEVVGVVGNVRHRGRSMDLRPEIYLPLAQAPERDVTLVVSSATEPLGLVTPVLSAIHAVDPTQAASRIRTLQRVVSEDTFTARFLTGLLAGFAAIALGLAALGLHGVVSFAVAQSTREIGIRMALGARVGNVLALVLRRFLGTAALGVAAGLCGALALGRVLGSLLYEVKPTDAPTLAGVSLLLAAVAFVASVVPARRAARVDPMVALRCE